jgi:hypothetical protein
VAPFSDGHWAACCKHDAVFLIGAGAVLTTAFVKDARSFIHRTNQPLLASPTWREFFVSESIPHQTDEEVERICSTHCIEPGDFDRPAQKRYWEDWFDIKGGPLAGAYHLLQRIDLGPSRDAGRGPLLEFNVGSHPGHSTHYVNAKDLLSLSLLQAR